VVRGAGFAVIGAAVIGAAVVARAAPKTARYRAERVWSA
jgi:hypothetical protein